MEKMQMKLGARKYLIGVLKIILAIFLSKNLCPKKFTYLSMITFLSFHCIY